jgi:hypothetical protein
MWPSLPPTGAPTAPEIAGDDGADVLGQRLQQLELAIRQLA